MKRIAGLYIAWLIVAGMLISAAVERHPLQLLHVIALVRLGAHNIPFTSARDGDTYYSIYIGTRDEEGRK
jgi:hypothetical protein